MSRYRRLEPTREDSGAAAVVSVAVGVGVAAVTWYLVRMFRAREDLHSPSSDGELAPARRARKLRAGPGGGSE